MKFLAALFVLLFVSSCSEPMESSESNREVSKDRNAKEELPFDTWVDVSNDHPAIVAAVEWAGSPTKTTVTDAKIKVTREFDFYRVTHSNENVTATDEIAKAKWKVVDESSAGVAISREDDGGGYQLLDRKLSKTTLATDQDEQNEDE